MLYPNPMLGCSKGARGLSVHMRVTGVFTGTTISPSPWLRQCPNRYTIRAGRNLPDKEFRYLRTVIVTAAVYWGFDSKLLHQRRMTSPLNLPAPGRCQSLYIVLIDFAETCVFVKQSLGPFHCGLFQLNLYNLTYLRHPFSRSYGVNLPSSLTTAHSSTLEYSSRLPVSVCGTI